MSTRKCPKSGGRHHFDAFRLPGGEVKARCVDCDIVYALDSLSRTDRAYALLENGSLREREVNELPIMDEGR